MKEAQKDEIIKSLLKVRALIIGSDLEIDKERLAMGDFSAVNMKDEAKMQQAYLALFEIFRKLEDFNPTNMGLYPKSK